MSRPILRPAYALSALMWLAGCSADTTQLVVVVESDIPVPAELDEVRVSVTGPNGTPVVVEQPLVGEGRASLPLTLGVSPGGSALGPVTIEAAGLLDGSDIVTRTVRTQLVRGESRLLVIWLLAACRGTTCAADETCTETGCAGIDVDPADLPPWTGNPPRPDGAPADAGPLDADVSPDASTSCESASDCDDGIDCTADVCDAGACSHRPDDSACTASAGGVCDGADGCQYPVCDETTCVAGACQTAACVGTRCERTNLCDAGQSCCAGVCAAAGCDDGNPCTDDSCGGSGCVNTPNTGPCEDGMFCNGADSCADSACSVHAGSPCAGSAICDESMDVCTGCIVDADCGAASYGSWGACGGFSDSCDQSGTQSRSVTSYTCMSGTCVGSTSTESQACSRSTDGTTCGATTCGGWGACGSFSDTCDESGYQSRTCTDHVCASGTCGSSSRMESSSCTRSTDGTSCGTTSCGGWGACGGFSDACDQSGSQSRTCTDYACGGGSCGTSTRTEMQGCSRSTNGSSCGTTSCTGWSACSGFSTTCDQTGTQSRTCTDYTCSGGSCGSAMRAEGQACSRSTDGMTCDDGVLCTDSDQCSGGSCFGTDFCGGGCYCDSAMNRCVDPINPMSLCPF